MTTLNLLGNLNLTEKEQKLVSVFLSYNECGATTPEELLEDNYSCQCIDDLRDITDFSNNELGGLLSSLQEKGILQLEERKGATLPKNATRSQMMNFEPDLYWVNDSFIETLPEEMVF